MSVSGYKSFAIFGANPLGKYLIEYLIEKKNAGIISSVSIMTRSSNGYEDLVEKGAKRITVDYTSSSSIASAVAGVDVIVSTCNNDALGLQIDIAKIAKAQGVKLFVPSEFGKPTDGATDGFFAVKDGVKKVLREIDLPYAIIYNGSWPDWLFVPKTAKMFGIDFANSKAEIPGSGTGNISFTHQRDAARFLAHVFTALPKEKIEWRTFRIEGERISLNKIVSEWEARTGKKVALTHRPRSEFEDAIAKNPDDIISIINLALTSEELAHNPEDLANNDFPEWSPGKVIDTVLELNGQK